MSPSERSFLLGVDVGGAEASPAVLLSELSDALAHLPLCLYAPREKIPPDLTLSPLHQICVTSQEIGSEESPFFAVRRKRDSSLMRGLYDLKAKKIDGFLSLANTGALVLASSFILGRLPGVHCPALIAHLPSLKGEVALLDAGASSTRTLDRLHELFTLAAIYAEEEGKGFNPRVGLLNIGHEEMKGTESLRQMDSELKAFPSSSYEYVGFIEPLDIFKGIVTIVVTDGFTGNVLLKTAESVYLLLRSEQQSSKILDKAGRLLGVKGKVYKGHGRVRPQALVKIIRTLVESV